MAFKAQEVCLKAWRAIVGDEDFVHCTNNALHVTNAGSVSVDNSTTTLLIASSVFTGEWEDVSAYSSLVVAVKTDQDGTYSIQFSPDGVNVDSTLTRYYRTAQIEPPHRFTITRQYCRVVFTNTSASDQTYIRLQTSYGSFTDLNAPIDSVLSQDFDAIAVRPTDYRTEVALSRRQGSGLWNKFGYNADVDTGTELIAAFGGTMALHTTASTFTIVSSAAADDDGGTGCNSVVVYGVDSNWDEATEIVLLDGVTPVVTTTSWIGHPNRVAMYLCGTGQANAGLITVTRTTGGATVATIPLGEGVSQQCVFTIPQKHKFNAEWMLLGAARQGAGADPIVTFKAWVYSVANNGKQEVFRKDLDTSVSVTLEIDPKLPFPIGEKSIFWLEATTNRDNTSVTGRFSGILHNDVDH